jgi:hypothetical protein
VRPPVHARAAFGPFSPDGRWLAYTSLESGSPQVYVQSFPRLRDRAQVSVDGGVFPQWSSTRAELFYGTLEGRLMVVPYAVSADKFAPDTPRDWAKGLTIAMVPGYQTFAVHPDGRRLAVLKGADFPVRDSVVLMLNFFDEVRRITAARDRQ